MELNPALAATPELVNSDPYGEGWMVKMKVNSIADVHELMDADAYAAVAGRINLRFTVVRICIRLPIIFSYLGQHCG